VGHDPCLYALGRSVWPIKGYKEAYFVHTYCVLLGGVFSCGVLRTTTRHDPQKVKVFASIPLLFQKEKHLGKFWKCERGFVDKYSCGCRHRVA
jgi:hypothetical protein